MASEIHDYTDERVNKLCDQLIDASFALSSLMAPVLVYMILKESKGMGIYRWYLLNEVCWEYLYDVTLTLWKPVCLGPLLAVFSQSFVQFGRHGTWITYCAAAIFTVNSGLGPVMAIFYRFAQAYPGAFREFFERKIILVYMTVHIFCYAYFISPIISAALWNPDEVRAYLNAYSPRIGYSTDVNRLLLYKRTTVSELYWLSMSIWYAIFAVMGLGFLSKLYLHAIAWKVKAVNDSTYRLQIMLLKALIIQTCIGGAFVIVPKVVIGLTLYSAYPKGGPIVTTMLALTTMHASVNYVILLCYITPYRRALLKLFKKLTSWLRKERFGKQTSSGTISFVSTGGQRRL